MVDIHVFDKIPTAAVGTTRTPTTPSAGVPGLVDKATGADTAQYSRRWGQSVNCVLPASAL